MVAPVDEAVGGQREFVKTGNAGGDRAHDGGDASELFVEADAEAVTVRVDEAGVVVVDGFWIGVEKAPEFGEVVGGDRRVAERADLLVDAHAGNIPGDEENIRGTVVDGCLAEPVDGGNHGRHGEFGSVRYFRALHLRQETAKLDE